MESKPENIKASHVHPDYMLKEVSDERWRKIDERCKNEHDEIEALKQGQKAINTKITATLVFVIITLASILTSIVTKLL